MNGRGLVAVTALVIATTLTALHADAASPRSTDSRSRKASAPPPLPDTRSAPASAASVDNRSIRIPLADPVPGSLPAEGTPPGWNLKEFSGRADVELTRIDGQLALRLRSGHSSFALYHDVALRVEDFPILSWSWKVLRLPQAGDVRVRGRDDQAAQIYVIFPRWPSPLSRSDVIGYVWDTTAPIGTRTQSSRADNVRIIVVDSGRSRAGPWRRYERNVADDYAALFGRKPPRVGKIALMIDSNDTRSDAEAYVGSIAFRKTR